MESKGVNYLLHMTAELPLIPLVLCDVINKRLSDVTSRRSVLHHRPSVASLLPALIL